MHARKAFLFHRNPNNGEIIPWQKRNGDFDVTMGAPDGAEVCELVGLYILHKVKADPRLKKLNFGLYRDDGLGIHPRLTTRELKQLHLDLKEVFTDMQLRITFENEKGTKTVNFLDITLDLVEDKHKPYKKPNDTSLYVHMKSNHPPTVLKQVPIGINQRLSNISSTEEDFKAAIPEYQKALQDAGYEHRLTKTERPSTGTQRKDRKRKIIWFNPPPPLIKL